MQGVLADQDHWPHSSSSERRHLCPNSASTGNFQTGLLELSAGESATVCVAEAAGGAERGSLLGMQDLWRTPITLVLRHLHWFPEHHPIQFKLTSPCPLHTQHRACS